MAKTLQLPGNGGAVSELSSHTWLLASGSCDVVVPVLGSCGLVTDQNKFPLTVFISENETLLRLMRRFKV